MHENIDEKYLVKKIHPFQAYDIKDINELLIALKSCSFQGRNLGNALDILEKMVSNDKVLTVLTLSGAMVPAGMGDLICVLMEHKLIDIIVTTGANIIHDLVDVFSKIGHFYGTPYVNDEELFKLRINRIYDTYLPENNYELVENKLLAIFQEIFINKDIFTTPSEFISLIGEKIQERCIVSIAARNDIPIFIPAFSDSELALNLIKYSKKEKYNFQFDILEDVKKFANLIKNSEEYGSFIIGGGVPRNWAQQVFPLLDQIDNIQNLGYNYSVRIHTAMEYDGGLSGCTISESKTWGKYSLKSEHISVWCDATIALPILVTGLIQRLNINKL